MTNLPVVMHIHTCNTLINRVINFWHELPDPAVLLLAPY